jgi:hypothetical protein
VGEPSRVERNSRESSERTRTQTQTQTEEEMRNAPTVRPPASAPRAPRSDRLVKAAPPDGTPQSGQRRAG